MLIYLLQKCNSLNLEQLITKKNAAQLFEIEYGYRYGDKEFVLNGICYGCEDDFTKQTWRRFVKLKAFL